MKRNELSINLAVSLIKTGEFLGLDEESQESLSAFIESLSCDEKDLLDSKISEDSLDRVHSLFGMDVHSSSMVVFWIQIPLKKKTDFDASKLKVLGFTKNTHINDVSVEESDSIIYPYNCTAVVVAEIDHEALRLIEKTPANTKRISTDFSIYFPSENIKFEKKFI